MSDEGSKNRQHSDGDSGGKLDGEKNGGKAKKSKMFREEVKDRHTTHWDLDYISQDELERLMMKERPGVGPENGNSGDKPRRGSRPGTGKNPAAENNDSES